MNKPLLKQALDALIDSVDDSRTVLAQHLENYGEHYRTERSQAMRQTVTDVEAAIAALEAELAKPDPEPVGYVYWNKGHAEGALGNQNLKPGTPLYAAPPYPEGCLSNCDTCAYAWGSPANPGHCSMFFEEPQGVCPKHSEPHQTRNCSRHPDAPHGPDGAGCKCHNWSPGEAS